MATFANDGYYQFHFVNHSNALMAYSLGSAAGHAEIYGEVNSGQQVDSQEFYHNGTLEEGNVPVIELDGAPLPGFRFWSGDAGLYQYINALAGNGYTVTKDTSKISEITGNGFRIIIDAGGRYQTSRSIFFQVYNA